MIVRSIPILSSLSLFSVFPISNAEDNDIINSSIAHSIIIHPNELKAIKSMLYSPLQV